MKLHIGTSGYAYKEWKGIFYPEKIHPNEMLRYYGSRLNSVEINYTFHHMPTYKVVSPWAEEVPEDFSFVLKAPQIITHFKRLKNVEEETAFFFANLAPLGTRLGAVFFQFPPNFHVDHARLEGFLGLVPQGVRCAFEFRSTDWLTEETRALLGSRDFSLCTSDTDEAPARELLSSATWGYLRLRRSVYSEAEMTEWLGRLNWSGWEEAFVFFKHEDEAQGPEEALRMGELFRLAIATPRP